MVTEFHNDDEGYLKWLRTHPTGFVINCEPEPRASYLILHRASCHTISGEPASGEHWTVAYKKVCGETETELGLWSRREVGVLPDRCGGCL